MHRETATQQTKLCRPSQSSRIRPRTAPTLNEARRIAYELLKLHRDGAIKEPADASFYANLIHTFGATYTKANSSTEQSSTELTLTC